MGSFTKTHLRRSVVTVGYVYYCVYVIARPYTGARKSTAGTYSQNSLFANNSSLNKVKWHIENIITMVNGNDTFHCRECPKR